MTDRAAEYKTNLADIRKRGGQRWRTPAGLREEIVAWASGLRSSGHGIGEIAAAIGLSESALRRWMTPTEADGKMRRVSVRGSHGSLVGAALSLVTPAGYRLEGLSIDQAVEVLRRM
jgi:hypothetical protein